MGKRTLLLTLILAGCCSCPEPKNPTRVLCNGTASTFSGYAQILESYQI